MRPYRLLLTTWQPFAAGSIQSVQYLAEGLNRRGHEVRVACPEPSVIAGRLRSSGVPVVPFDFRRGWSRRSARSLADLIARFHIELVDAQESRDRKAAIMARVLYRSRAKLVITRRQESASFPLENMLYAAASDRVIAISEGVARRLARRGGLRRGITVVHTGLDPERVAGAVDTDCLEDLRAELGLDPGLCTVGVVARRKDQETMLRAVETLGRPLNVLFVGIERDPELAALEERLPRGSRVAYTGFRERVVPFYRILDIKVLTTRAEGLSQAILEAMAVGVPVISAATGGTPEVIQHGVNGLLYPPGDAVALAARIARLLDDQALSARFVDHGRNTVGGPFHADEFVRRTETVYRHLLADRRN